MTHTTPRAIPTPPNFPVTWERPEDQSIFWTLDRMHFPDSLPQMDGDVTRVVYRGFGKAAEHYQMPIRVEARHINNYHYSGAVPVAMSPEEMAETERRSEEHFAATIAELDRLWNDEYLPEIERYIDDWAGFDLSNATLEQLTAHLAESITRFERLWAIHFLTIIPTMLAINLFDELYHDLFDDAGPFDAFQLLEGFDNKTVETGRALWKLSREVLASPTVLKAIQELPEHDVVPALEQSEEGRNFLVGLNAYLETYGRRSDKLGLSTPSWLESPTPVITRLKDFVLQSTRDFEAERVKLAAEREQMIDEVRERLRPYPSAVRQQFEAQLRAAQIGTILSEDHTFYIDFGASFAFRQVILEVGRRLARHGVIESRDDIFHLSIEEMRESLDNLDHMDRRSLISERKAQLEHFGSIEPPPALGTKPPGPPPDSPGSRVNAKFFGVQPATSDDPSVLLGAAGSSGLVRGPAKIVLSLDEAGKLQPGDILIAPTTIPSWTPLFATVSAVVTDTGGILSHCAIVAREYGIPAVVGTGRATSVLSDGQIIEVDGDRGRIRIVHPG